MRALLQNLLRHHRQAVEALAHVRRAASQEYPRRWRQRDHRARTPITRDSASAWTVASTLTLMPDGSSLPITPSLRRSEEHTSELQSLMRTSDSALVFKKKHIL